MNLVDVILFQASLTPAKPAVLSKTTPSGISYGAFRTGVLSAQRHLVEFGVHPGHVVALNMDNPIAHLMLVCALYRMGATSTSIEDDFTGLPSGEPPIDIVLSHRWIALSLTNQLPPKIILVDSNWFGHKASADFAVGVQRPPDPALDWISLITSSVNSLGKPRSVKTKARSLEAQVLAQHIAAPPDWERQVLAEGLHTLSGLVHSLSALWAGRTVCLTDTQAARNTISIHKHQYLVIAADHIEALLQAQEQNYVQLPSLKAACFEVRECSHSMKTRGLMTVCSNLRIQYAHAEVGVIAFADAMQIRDIKDAIGFVAPWAEVQAIDHSGKPVEPGTEGILRFRSRFNSLFEQKQNDVTEEWIYPEQTARILPNGLLIVTESKALH